MNETKFFKRVYDIVSRIPEGQVATYGQIALIAGNPYTSRIVGYAMSSAPSEQNLPCHRVVNKEGRMANFAVIFSIDFFCYTVKILSVYASESEMYI